MRLSSKLFKIRTVHSSFLCVKLLICCHFHCVLFVSLKVSLNGKIRVNVLSDVESIGEM